MGDGDFAGFDAAQPAVAVADRDVFGAGFLEAADDIGVTARGQAPADGHARAERPRQPNWFSHAGN
jgi:hypothetical protein